MLLLTAIGSTLVTIATWVMEVDGTIVLVSDKDAIVLVSAMIWSAILAVPMTIVSAQKCRDFGWTGWAVLLGFIPYLNLIFFLAILLVPGNKGSNRYGADPLRLHRQL